MRRPAADAGLAWAPNRISRPTIGKSRVEQMALDSVDVGTRHDLFSRNAPLIGGRWLDHTSAGMREHINPATGRAQATLHVGGAAEIELAVRSAEQGSKVWRKTSPDRRRDILLRLADLVLRDADRIVRTAALENGTPVITRAGLDLAVAWFRYYAGWADKIEGGLVEVEGGLNYVRHEPYGVIGAIIPWNAPLVSIGMKVLPALAAGNAVVLKPPTLTPFVALQIGELALEAGLPEGVLNVTPGDAEAGEALIAHPGVAKISFTGGPGVARQVLSIAAQHLKPVTLELGGKSANLVFEDADLADAATMSAIHGVAVLSGQACVLPTRALVHGSIYDAFVERLVGTVGAFKVGDPLDPTSIMGPVVSAGSCERILGVIDRAKSEGAGRLAAGGERLGGDLAGGYFLSPAVFTDVDPQSHLAREEVFGPVLSVMRFGSEEEAISMANDSVYGLGAYLHTRDVKRAHRVAAELQAGTVGVNSPVPMAPGAPFGGFKQSGFGREGGRAGLEEFLQLKNVFVSLQ